MPTNAFFTLADASAGELDLDLVADGELLLLDLGDGVDPCASSSFQVSRTRSALPLTLNTLSPDSFSIQ